MGDSPVLPVPVLRSCPPEPPAHLPAAPPACQPGSLQTKERRRGCLPWRCWPWRLLAKLRASWSRARRNAHGANNRMRFTCPDASSIHHDHDSPMARQQRRLRVCGEHQHARSRTRVALPHGAPTFTVGLVKATLQVQLFPAAPSHRHGLVPADGTCRLLLAWWWCYYCDTAVARFVSGALSCVPLATGTSCVHVCVIIYKNYINSK